MQISIHIQLAMKPELMLIVRPHHIIKTGLRPVSY